MKAGHDGLARVGQPARMVPVRVGQPGVVRPAWVGYPAQRTRARWTNFTAGRAC
jgi:hypothetical protein